MGRGWPTVDQAVDRPVAAKLPERRLNLAVRSGAGERWMVAVVAIGLSGFAALLYRQTLAPSIAWSHEGADSGDLVTAAYTLGVPHPTGYPLYTLLGHLATRLTPDEPAWGMNLLTALCATLAVGVTAWLAGELARPAGAGPRALAALTAGGLFAVAPGFWSQAVITEVYALAALLLAGILLALARWRALWAASAGPAAARWLILAGFLFGLALAHQATIALIAPVIALYVALTAGRAILRPAFWRRSVPALLALAPGLLLYLYLPWRAAADPPVNWGRPSTWDGFLWTVLARPYQPNTFQWEMVTRDPRGALDLVLTRLTDQFLLALLPIGVWGAVWLIRRDRVTGGLLLLAAGIFTLNRLTYRSWSIDAYFIPLFQITAVWIGLGWADVVRWCGEHLPTGRLGRLPGRLSVHFLAGSAVLAIMAAEMLISYPIMDLSREMRPREFGIGTLQAMPRSALVLTDRDDRTFSLWYAQHVLGVRPDVVLVSPSLLMWPWYEEHLRRLYPDLPLGELGAEANSRPVEFVRQALRDNSRLIVLGEERSVIGTYFEVEQVGDLTVIVRDPAETGQ